MELRRVLTMLGTILMLVATIGLAMACNENNDFVLGENVTLCLGEGYYQNNSNYLSFDGSETCKIFAYYPNNTNIVSDGSMSFISNRFQYNLSNLSNGTYNAFTYCYKNQGYWEDWWTFTVYPENCSNYDIRQLDGTCSNITNYPQLRSSIATGTIYQNGEKIKTMTACLDETNKPISSLATVTIYYPNNTIWINNATMSQMEVGIYNYSDYAPFTKGIYTIKSTCINGTDESVAIAEMQLPDWITTSSDYTAPNIISITPINNTLQTSTTLVNFNSITNENANCSININGTTYNMTSIGVNQNLSKVLANNFYQYNVTCWDSSSNYATSYNYFLTTAFAPSGGGSPTINLNNINITYSDWYIGEENTLFIETLDKNGNKTDVTSIYVMNDSFISYQMSRMSVGSYQALIKLNSSVNNITLRVVVDDSGKIIEQKVNISLIEKPIITDVKNTVTSFSVKADSWITENKNLFWISVLITILGLIIISSLIYYLKKQ